VRQIIQKVDGAVPILYARTMDEQLAPRRHPGATSAQVAVVFGCVALALAAIGLYGVRSYGIARRKGAFAIRMAQRARPGRVIAMVLRETSIVITGGLLVGGGLRWAAARGLPASSTGWRRRIR
jgi:ABC-type antimicrobial peptide transport system permease subunit